MQKKIYSLFFVSCSLALFFLASCDSGGGNNGGGGSSSSAATEAGCTNPNGCDNIAITFKDVEVKTDGNWNLTVWGQVVLEGEANDTRFIKSIVIEMWDQDVGGKKTIMEKQDLSVTSYDLRTGQTGFAFKSCDLSGHTQRIFITVSLGGCEQPTDPLCAPKIEGFDPFKKPHADCQTYELVPKVSPAGAGSVTLNPQPPYEKNQEVTLTPVPSGTYAFFNWSEGGVYSASESYKVTVDGKGSDVTAVFVDSRSLGQPITVDVKAGETIKFAGSISIAVFNANETFQASGNFKLINEFQDRNMGLNSPQNKTTIDDGTISSPSKTVDFVPAIGSELDLIEYSPESYFVARTGANNWGEWYLLRARNRTVSGNNCRTGDTPKCTEVTIWKAQ